MRIALVLVAVVLALAACQDKTDVQLWVDGFQPKNVRFEIEDKGPLSKADVDALAHRADIDGSLRLPDGTCPAPGCRVSIVSVFVHNMDSDAKPEPAPVIRLKVPEGKPRRLPIAFRGGDINKGRIGRIRWVVEMYPEEKNLTAVLSSSVELTDAPPPKPAPPPLPPG
jgi:hypothetical protein